MYKVWVQIWDNVELRSTNIHDCVPPTIRITYFGSIFDWHISVLHNKSLMLISGLKVVAKLIYSLACPCVFLTKCVAIFDIWHIVWLVNEKNATLVNMLEIEMTHN